MVSPLWYWVIPLRDILALVFSGGAPAEVTVYDPPVEA